MPNLTAATPSCSACSGPIPDPAERWPDNDSAAGTVCQVCWKTQCSRPWWPMVRLLVNEDHA